MSEPVKIVDRQSRDFGECLGIVGLLVIETSGLLLRGKQEKLGVVTSRARLLQRQQNVNDYAGRVVGQFDCGTRILRVIHERDARATF